MRLLDLYCGAGGAAVGYFDAGFDEILGVDINQQPRYPFAFLREDALEVLGSWRNFRQHFDLIHASPPCQAYSLSKSIQGREHPDLLGPTRALLDQTGVPWVIENVYGAPMHGPVVLTGQMFGLDVYRPRYFETNWPLEKHPAPAWPPPPQVRVGKMPRPGEVVQVVGHFTGVAVARRAMDIHWMSRNELAQAVPPAYTNFIGKQFLEMSRRSAISISLF